MKANGWLIALVIGALAAVAALAALTGLFSAGEGAKVTTVQEGLVFTSHKIRDGQFELRVRVAPDAAPGLAIEEVFLVVFEDANGDRNFQEDEKRGSHFGRPGAPTSHYSTEMLGYPPELEDPWIHVRVATTAGEVERNWPLGHD